MYFIKSTRNNVPRLYSWVLLLAVGMFSNTSYAASDDPFIFELKSDLETIGDIKPSFIVYQDKPLPKVSINYILKRYIKLFENANSPNVKIDALNRINNLREKYKLDSKKLTIDKVTQSQVVLDSYDRIVDSGVFYQRMDELLYQTAKATKFIGNSEESIKRLKLLVGLYPKSDLVDESMFRIAETYFDLGMFDKAEAQYKKVLAFTKDSTFHHRANFKLGWAVFRQDRFADSAVHASKVLDKYPELRNAIGYDTLGLKDQDIVDDTFRLFSTMFSQDRSGESIEVLQQSIGHKDYAYLLYDSLFRFHLRSERFRDAGLVARGFTDNYQMNFDAYRMAQNEIQTYRRGNFDILEWEAKENFVKNFGVHSPYWKTLEPSQLEIVRPLLVEALDELAHLYYVRMQTAYAKDSEVKSEPAEISAKASSYYVFGKQAADYYEELVLTRGQDRYSGENLYLAAEAAYKIGDYRRAISLYERAAYENVSHPKAVQAGYASVLTYDDIKVSNSGNTQDLGPSDKLLRREAIERFAAHFPMANQTAGLLNDLANEYYRELDYINAVEVSSRVVQSRSAPAAILYSSWLVNAHSHFELENYSLAEKAYQKLVTYNKKSDVEVLSERLAASVYKQAEKESAIGKSAELYLRVVDLVPDSSIAPTALFDASTQFLQIQNWPQSIATLNVFQERFPDSELYEDASDKLVYAYLENEEPIPAAEKLVEISNSTADLAKASNSLYRAAEIYLENDFAYEAVGLLDGFVKRYPDQFELNIEAYFQSIRYFDRRKEDSNANKWRAALVEYEQDRISQRNGRSAYVAANAALSLLNKDILKFEAISLSLPLKKSLDQKTRNLKALVAKLESLADYEVSEVISAATYKIGTIYRTLAQDIMSSERPDKLTELQLEQYDILLEEQAYSFEEQALEIYQINLDKVPDGEYDRWIAATYEVLAEMNPTEFERKSKAILHADEYF